MAQQKKKSTQGIRKRAAKKKRAEAPAPRKRARETSVDLGPIEPEVADILAIIDQAKGRSPVQRAIEPEDERGAGGAAARRGRGGRVEKRTPQQTKKTARTKQL